MKLKERLERMHKVEERMHRWTGLASRDRFVWGMMRRESRLLLRRSLGLCWAVLRQEDSDRESWLPLRKAVRFLRKHLRKSSNK